MADTLAGGSVRLRIRRQDRPGTAARWEEFSVPREPGMKVIYCLMLIQRKPVTSAGGATSPIAWESHCLEEVCGACTMIINGRVRQACSTLINEIAPHGEPIKLEPMSKFPNVRDLIVDRSRMFEHLKKVRAWIAAAQGAIEVEGEGDIAEATDDAGNGTGAKKSARSSRRRAPGRKDKRG